MAASTGFCGAGVLVIEAATVAVGVGLSCADSSLTWVWSALTVTSAWLGGGWLGVAQAAMALTTSVKRTSRRM